MITGKDFDKFSTFDEFVDAVNMGLDIEFFIENVRYNISWNYKPFICVCPDGDAVFYENADDLLNNHKINGKSLKDLWRNIEVYSM